MKRETIEIWGICTRFEKGDDFYRIYLETEQGETMQVSVSEYDVHYEVEVGRHYYAKGEDATDWMGQPALFAEFVDRWGRYCSVCGKRHDEGYYDESTCLYFCSDACLHQYYSDEEIQALQETEDEDGDEYEEDLTLYWTEWYN